MIRSIRDRLMEEVRRAVGRDAPAGVLDQRWVVVDIETTGLDARQDAILAIGAVAVTARRVTVSDSFEMMVRPAQASTTQNILIHQIGAEAQLRGTDPAEAITRFRHYVGASALVAFHAPFDRSFLERSIRIQRCHRLQGRWLDVAELAPALNPGVGADSLDEWLAHFAIPNDQRHNAASDALATAMLFMRLLTQLPAGSVDAAEAYRLAEHGRHLGR